MRLRQVHGAGPFALDHLRQIGGLLLRRAVGQDRRDRALGEARIHGQRHVGRRHDLVDDGRHRLRQALAAELRRRRDAHPAALGILPVGLLESLRRGDAAVVVAGAALLVAGAVDRLHHLFGELGRFAQHRLDQVGGGVGETGQIVQAADLEDVVEQEHRVVDGSLVGRHVSPPWAQFGGHGACGAPRCNALRSTHHSFGDLGTEYPRGGESCAA